jgi:hypothetical protein
LLAAGGGHAIHGEGADLLPLDMPDPGAPCARTRAPSRSLPSGRGGNGPNSRVGAPATTPCRRANPDRPRRERAHAQCTDRPRGGALHPGVFRRGLARHRGGALPRTVLSDHIAHPRWRERADPCDLERDARSARGRAALPFRPDRGLFGSNVAAVCVWSSEFMWLVQDWTVPPS